MRPTILTLTTMSLAACAAPDEPELDLSAQMVLDQSRAGIMGWNGEGFFEWRTGKTTQWVQELGYAPVIRVPGGGMSRFANPINADGTLTDPSDPTKKILGWGRTEAAVNEWYDKCRDPNGDGNYDDYYCSEAVWDDGDPSTTDDAVGRRAAELTAVANQNAYADGNYLERLKDLSDAVPGLRVIYDANLETTSNNFAAIAWLKDHGVDVVAVEAGNEMNWHLDYLDAGSAHDRAVARFAAYREMFEPLFLQVHAAYPEIVRALPLAPVKFATATTPASCAADADCAGAPAGYGSCFAGLCTNFSLAKPNHENTEWNAQVEAYAKDAATRGMMEGVTTHIYLSDFTYRSQPGNPFDPESSPQPHKIPGAALRCLNVLKVCAAGQPCPTMTSDPEMEEKFSAAWDTIVGDGSIEAELRWIQTHFADERILFDEWNTKEYEWYANTLLNAAWQFSVISKYRYAVDYIAQQNGMSGDYASMISRGMPHDEGVEPPVNDCLHTPQNDTAEHAGQNLCRSQASDPGTRVRRLGYWAAKLASEATPDAWITPGQPLNVSVSGVPLGGTRTVHLFYVNKGGAFTPAPTFTAPRGATVEVLHETARVIHGSKLYSSAGKIDYMTPVGTKGTAGTMCTQGTSMEIKGITELPDGFEALPAHSFGYVSYELRVSMRRGG